MLKVEIDGKEIEVAHGATVMEAAHQLGIYVPHFCYHEKLSIAANCRMCLVEVEKAPKPLPACATPCTDGMKVKTHSANAKKAQNGVMEFLLVNHPLDCPICDQGGECQLQDLAVGYGKSASRYQEEKRVVLSKDVGPLVSAEEMSRCIQCTRCVRFGQEVAGVMELGMIGRGEHSEIVAFVGQSVDSELSGNMIDLCPVGALTSKPFRYSARTWELARRRAVSPHDGLGSNLVVQVKQGQVMRVLPLENADINECWLSDRDRFSYTALNRPERLTTPMLRDAHGTWQTTDWQTAIETVVSGLRAAGAHTGALVSPNATLEEMFLAKQVLAGLGSSAIEHRLRQSDWSGEAHRAGIPWLGMPISELASCDRVLVIGSFLRKEHPLIAQRLRQAAKRGAQVSVIHSADDDQLMPIAQRLIVAPNALVQALANVHSASEGVAAQIARSLRSGKKVAVLLGNFAQHHPEASQLFAHAQALATEYQAHFGVLSEGANTVGGYLAGLAGQSNPFASPRKAWVVFGVEPELDCADGVAAQAALSQADFVVALSMFRDALPTQAKVALPLAAFTETSGSYVSMEGRVQSFNATVKPLGDARPGWKILRVLGSALGVPGFEFDTSEQVRDACLNGRNVSALLSQATTLAPATVTGSPQGSLQRVSDVPIYFADSLVRRAAPLQQTSDARTPQARMNGPTMAAQGLQAGDRVRLETLTGHAELETALDHGVPDACVRVAAAHSSTAALGPMFGELRLTKIAVQRAA